MKKIKKSIVYGLLIVISSIAYAANSDEKSDDLVFTVLRKTKSLEYLATQCGKSEDLKETLSALNITSLFTELDHLVKAEKKSGPATKEKIRLEARHLVDKQAFLEELSNEKLDTIEEQDLASGFKKLTDKIEADFASNQEDLQKLWAAFYKDQMADLRLLIEENQDTWTKVNALSKNKFKIEEEKQACIAFSKEKILCSSKKIAASKIKSLSEIMPYIINKLGSNLTQKNDSDTNTVSPIEENTDSEETETPTVTEDSTPNSNSATEQTSDVSTDSPIEENTDSEETETPAVTEDSTPNSNSATEQTPSVLTDSPIEENTDSEETPDNDL